MLKRFFTFFYFKIKNAFLTFFIVATFFIKKTLVFLFQSLLCFVKLTDNLINVLEIHNTVTRQIWAMVFPSWFRYINSITIGIDARVPARFSYIIFGFDKTRFLTFFYS